MSTKKHVTALGVPFDMAAFRAKNEKVRAVGNMNVNARGDVLDSNNNIIDSRNKRVNRMYEKTMQANAKPKRVMNQQSQESATQKIPEKEVAPGELMDLDDDVPNPKK